MRRLMPIVFGIVVMWFVGCAPTDEPQTDGGSSSQTSTSSDEDIVDKSAAAIRHSVEQDGITLSWEIRDTELHVVVSAPTTGWVAVGFSPSQAMKDANFILGYVADGEGVVADQFGFGNVQHDYDTTGDGTEDVTLLSAVEDDGVTTIGFSIPLDSGDEFDRVLKAGTEYPVILAYGPDGADDFTTYHKMRTTVRIEL